MHYDIAIVGAGPAGISFACMLEDSGLKIALVEKLPESVLADPPVDGRDIALTHLSKKILTRLNVWQNFGDDEISPIQEALVLDGDDPYTLDFDTGSKSTDALGYLVRNNVIRRALYDQAKQMRHITWLYDTEVTDIETSDAQGTLTLSSGETVTASLLVAADTRFSETRRKMGIGAEMKDFGRVAIVCEMEHERSHNNTAFECFHYGRTLAILPMPGNISSAVITLPGDQAEQVMKMSESEFNADITQRMDNRLGKMKLIDKRYPYPLVAVHAKKFYTKRFALMGDAAVGMHPVTAHGFNLGLSAGEILSEEIKYAKSKGESIASDFVLKRYQWKHRHSTLPMFHGTNKIVGLFTDDSFPAKLVRKAVLRASNHIPPIKWAIRNKLMSENQVPTLTPPFFGGL